MFGKKNYLVIGILTLILNGMIVLIVKFLSEQAPIDVKPISNVIRP